MAETTEEAIKRHERWLQEQAFTRHRLWLEQHDTRLDRAQRRMDRMERLGLRRLGALEEQVRRIGEMLERYLGRRGGDGTE